VFEKKIESRYSKGNSGKGESWMASRGKSEHHRTTHNLGAAPNDLTVKVEADAPYGKEGGGKGACQTGRRVGPALPGPASR